MNWRGRNGRNDVPSSAQIAYLQQVRDVDEGYRPVIDDVRGRFPEDLRVMALRGAKAAVAAAARLRNTSNAEYVRQAPVAAES